MDCFGKMSGVNMETNTNINNNQANVVGLDSTGINDKNTVRNDITVYNQQVLKRFHAELIKLMNRHNVQFSTEEIAPKETKVGNCYYTPNGIFVEQLTTDNLTKEGLQGYTKYKLPDDIANNRRIKEFIATNKIEYSDGITIGALMLNVVAA